MISDSPQQKKHILVIDEDRNVRDFFDGLFCFMGYAVHTAGGEPREMKRLTAGLYDMAFVDSDLYDREDTNRFIRSRGGTLRMPVVLFVGRHSHNGVENKIPSDFAALIFKPFALLDIQKVVLRIIGFPVSARVPRKRAQ